jgi:ferredoxin-nitrite reductase
MAIFQPSDTALDVREKVIAHGHLGFEALVAAEGKIAIEKLRLVGMYDDRQPGFFMMRIRIPAGRLVAAQVEAFAEIIERHVRRPAGASGDENFGEITTRQDLQIHWVRIEEVAAIWQKLESVGLNSLLACGDTVRNVTGCAMAGLVHDEAFDAGPVVEAVDYYFLTNPTAGVLLPRKFKVSITGSVEDCVITRINDLAFTPARREGRLGFNVWAGGGLSDYPRLASDLDIFVLPEQVVALVDACVRLYKDIGNFQDKAVNRFRAVVAEHGPASVRQQLVERFGAELPQAGLDLLQRKGDLHVGIEAEKRPGLYSFGLNVLVGRITGPQVRELARLAREYGDGGVHFSQRQNAVITGVPTARLADLEREPLIRQLDPIAASAASGVVACTSAPYCKFGIFDVKTRGKELAARLEGDGSEEPFLLHVSGCKASCAQPQIADVGLRATPRLEEDEGYVEAFDICVGGDPFADRLGRWIAYEVPLEDVYQGIRLLREEHERYPYEGESFGDFVLRRGWPLPAHDLVFSRGSA